MKKIKFYKFKRIGTAKRINEERTIARNKNYFFYYFKRFVISGINLIVKD